MSQDQPLELESIPEPGSHRRRPLRRRLSVLAALGAVVIPCVVVAGVKELERAETHSAPLRSGMPAAWAPSEEGSKKPAGAGPSGTPRTAHEKDRGKKNGPRPASSPTSAPGSHPGPASGSAHRPPPPSPGSNSTAPSRTPSAPEGSPLPSGPETLRRGDRGAKVEEMQRQLHSIGFYHGHRYGAFDADTETSLRKFQTWESVAGQVGSDTPGTYGPATRAALQHWSS